MPITKFVLFSVNYREEEEQRLLVHEKHHIDVSAYRPHLALSPDGEVVAISAGSALHLYLVSARVLHRKIDGIFSGMNRYFFHKA